MSIFFLRVWQGQKLSKVNIRSVKITFSGFWTSQTSTVVICRHNRRILEPVLILLPIGYSFETAGDFRWWWSMDREKNGVTTKDPPWQNRSEDNLKERKLWFEWGLRQQIENVCTSVCWSSVSAHLVSFISHLLARISHVSSHFLSLIFYRPSLISHLLSFISHFSSLICHFL
jgi:hypothetical protein